MGTVTTVEAERWIYEYAVTRDATDSAYTTGWNAIAGNER